MAEQLRILDWRPPVSDSDKKNRVKAWSELVAGVIVLTFFIFGIVVGGMTLTLLWLSIRALQKYLGQ